MVFGRGFFDGSAACVAFALALPLLLALRLTVARFVDFLIENVLSAMLSMVEMFQG